MRIDSNSEKSATAVVGGVEVVSSGMEHFAGGQVAYWGVATRQAIGFAK